MSSLLQKLVLGSSVAALAAMTPMGAFAQDNQNNSDIEQVVVSASRITIAGYSQPTPVTVVGAAQLEQDAYENIADSIRQLPEVTAPPTSYSANQGGGTPGTTGANFLNLRNLGVTRTLILFDGQRVVASNFTGGVDSTTLPTELIQRVDVVTGGASAAWGSDAIAGVVNFVLNKNFDGFKANLQGSDTSNGLDRQVSAGWAWGGDIDGGRGHLELAADYKDNPDSVLVTQENWYKGSYWVSNPAYAAGNGQPQLIVANNVGLATANTGGIINSSPAGVAGPGVTAASANALRGIEFVGAGIPQVVNYGNLTLGTLSNGGSLTDMDGQWPWQSIAGPSTTYTLFGYGRYKLTDAIQASVQLNYGYYTGKGVAGSNIQTGLVIRSDNAYIPASVASIMKNYGITSFTLGTLNANNFDNYTATGANFYSQAEGSLAPATTFNRRQLMRGVFNLDGTVGDDWSWNAYIQHSEVRFDSHTLGIANIDNLQNAEDAVTVTTANVGKTGLPIGSIACRSTVTGSTFTGSNGIAAQPGCIPLDVFGSGVASPQAIGYITGATNNSLDFENQVMQQDVMEGSMQGTLPWELPAGKVAIAFGVGYRKESARVDATPLGAVASFAQANFVISPPAHYDVLEGFGEVDAPILKNTIVNSLDFTMAGRMTSYSTSGLVETWKLGATSQVNDDIKLRTTWSVDIRAPQLSDLFGPASVGTSTQRDPKTNLSVQVTGFTEGNPNLVPEVARTISGGAVLTPTFIPGLSLSADWYSITVTGELSTIPIATIIAQCNASLPSVIHPGQMGNPNDPLCKALIFNPTTGTLQSTILTELNLNQQTVSGLDLAANYTMDFWDGTLAWATTDNYNDENTLTQPGIGVNDSAGSSTPTIPVGPKWKGILSATYGTGPYAFTAQTRWFGTSVANQNGNTGNLASAATANLYDPAHFEVPAVAYLDLRINYKWNDNIAFYGAVDNLLDIPPPLIPNTSANFQEGTFTQTDTNPAIYDLLGRVIRAGVRFNY